MDTNDQKATKRDVNKTEHRDMFVRPHNFSENFRVLSVVFIMGEVQNGFMAV